MSTSLRYLRNDVLSVVLVNNMRQPYSIAGMSRSHTQADALVRSSKQDRL